MTGLTGCVIVRNALLWQVMPVVLFMIEINLIKGNFRSGGSGISIIKLKHTRGETSMEKNRIRPITTGKSMRMTYQRQKEVLEMPNLIEVQKDSYQWFLDEGLK